MNSEMPALINQNFVERLNTEQVIQKKEFNKKKR